MGYKKSNKTYRHISAHNGNHWIFVYQIQTIMSIECDVAIKNHKSQQHWTKNHGKYFPIFDKKMHFEKNTEFSQNVSI